MLGKLENEQSPVETTGFCYSLNGVYRSPCFRTPISFSPFTAYS